MIEGINFKQITPQGKGFPKKTDTRRYYLDRGWNLYRDLVSEFVLTCDDRSAGAVVKRIKELFPVIMFDEVQDLSGRDFDLFERLIDVGVSVKFVGDPRQATYATTQSRTNISFSGSGVVKWLTKLEREQKLSLERHPISRRSNPEICEFSDSVYPLSQYPEMPATESRMTDRTGHDGVFLVRPCDVQAYVEEFHPQLLVWNSKSPNHGLAAKNMGEAKGMTFDRVLIQPTDTITDFLRKGSSLKDQARAKLYVAATRSRYSTTFVLDNAGGCNLPYWYPEEP